MCPEPVCWPGPVAGSRTWAGLGAGRAKAPPLRTVTREGGSPPPPPRSPTRADPDAAGGRLGPAAGLQRVCRKPLPTNKAFHRAPRGEGPQKCVTRVRQGQATPQLPFPLVASAGLGSPSTLRRATEKEATFLLPHLGSHWGPTGEAQRPASLPPHLRALAGSEEGEAHAGQRGGWGSGDLSWRPEMSRHAPSVGVSPQGQASRTDRRQVETRGPGTRSGRAPSRRYRRLSCPFGGAGTKAAFPESGSKPAPQNRACRQPVCLPRGDCPGGPPRRQTTLGHFAVSITPANTMPFHPTVLRARSSGPCTQRSALTLPKRRDRQVQCCGGHGEDCS